MSTLVKQCDRAQIEALYTRMKPLSVRESHPSYTHWQLKLKDMTVTVYTSGKVVFQGADLEWLQEEPAEQDSQTGRNAGSAPAAAGSSMFPQAGSDEVGTGDYFGPVTVAACYVSEETAPVLQKMDITDSKKMTDAAIRKAGPIIRDLCPHSLMVVPPAKYNEVHEHHNIVDMKAKLHDQAWKHLAGRVRVMPELSVVDQFVQEKSYYKYAGTKAYRPLKFETKAESRYLAVAAASVLAREAFLKYWDKMEEDWDMSFHKGAGPAVDRCGREFLARYGRQKLGDVAKLHFRNTEKISH